MTTRDPKVPGASFGLTWAVGYNSLPADPGRDMEGLEATIAISIDQVRAAVIASVPGAR